MTVKLKVVMMVFACCSYQSQAEDLNALKVKEYRLENGLTVWLNEDHSQPKVFGAVVVKAGAKDCPDTGIAHYFEHMMFKGTDRIGTLDYESEKVLLDSIAMKYDELAMTEDTAARARLQKEINELSIRSSERVQPAHQPVWRFRSECGDLIRCHDLFQYVFSAIYGSMGRDQQRAPD